jgi:hypothetical protein
MLADNRHPLEYYIQQLNYLMKLRTLKKANSRRLNNKCF